MFYKFCVAIIGTLTAITSIHEVRAFTMTYIPAETIVMTGATSSARFDVAEVLVSTYGATGTELQPRFHTGSMSFTGIFYLSWSIGWVAFHSGSEYQVSLHCGTQSLSDLSAPCNLIGTGWSELVGDVIFDDVEYIPSLGELSGSVMTYAGDFPLFGISLPLRPIVLNENIDFLKANHRTAFSIKEREKYGDSWYPKPINIRPTSSTYNQDYAIDQVDLSLATTYDFTLTDPNWSQTIISWVEVISDGISKTLEPGGPFFISGYCGASPPACPEGVIASSLGRVNPASPIADGNTFYEFSISLRDKYGNKIHTGSVEISYTGTVSAVNDALPILVTPYIDLWYDGLVFSGTNYFDPGSFDGLWSFTENTYLGQSIRYGIASLSPTNTLHQVILNKIIYRAPDGTETFIEDTSSLTFNPAFTFNVIVPGSIQVGTGNTLKLTFEQLTWVAWLNPELIVFLPIGGGVNARWTNLELPNDTHEPADISDLNTTYSDLYNSSWGKWINPVTGIFSLTGTYSPYSAYPSIEDAGFTAYIHYTGKDNLWSVIDVFYPIGEGILGTSKYQTSSVKLIGQNNARSEYGTIGTSKASKTKLLDAIRKNTALLSRNRTSDYNNTPYIIKNSNFTVTGWTFDTKRTIVVIGGDMRIDENIAKGISPLAIIALTDSAGNGGNIRIDPTVTDIHASLIAEHSILSTDPTVKEYQLYIYWSVISANTLGDTAARICPYYITSECTEEEAAKYDFEVLRSGFDGVTHISSSETAHMNLDSGVVIEYDQRIQQDPPPVLY